MLAFAKFHYKSCKYICKYITFGFWEISLFTEYSPLLWRHIQNVRKCMQAHAKYDYMGKHFIKLISVIKETFSRNNNLPY